MIPEPLSLATALPKFHPRAFKGIVQRDLTGVETRLKKSALLSYSVGKFPF
jgi:hypothetical protein